MKPRKRIKMDETLLVENFNIYIYISSAKELEIKPIPHTTKILKSLISLRYKKVCKIFKKAKCYFQKHSDTRDPNVKVTSLRRLLHGVNIEKNEGTKLSSVRLCPTLCLALRNK